MFSIYSLTHKVETIESKLDRLKKLKQSMDELQAEMDMIKQDVISGYFDATHSDTFVNQKGLVLATYKSQMRTQFKTTEFKKHEPSLYENYLDIKEVKVFLLK